MIALRIIKNYLRPKEIFYVSIWDFTNDGGDYADNISMTLRGKSINFIVAISCASYVFASSAAHARPADDYLAPTPESNAGSYKAPMSYDPLNGQLRPTLDAKKCEEHVFLCSDSHRDAKMDASIPSKSAERPKSKRECLEACRIERGLICPRQAEKDLLKSYHSSCGDPLQGDFDEPMGAPVNPKPFEVQAPTPREEITQYQVAEQAINIDTSLLKNQASNKFDYFDSRRGNSICYATYGSGTRVNCIAVSSNERFTTQPNDMGTAGLYLPELRNPNPPVSVPILRRGGEDELDISAAIVVPEHAPVPVPSKKVATVPVTAPPTPTATTPATPTPVANTNPYQNEILNRPTLPPQTQIASMTNNEITGSSPTAPFSSPINKFNFRGEDSSEVNRPGEQNNFAASQIGVSNEASRGMNHRKFSSSEVRSSEATSKDSKSGDDSSNGKTRSGASTSAQLGQDLNAGGIQLASAQKSDPAAGNKLSNIKFPGLSGGEFYQPGGSAAGSGGRNRPAALRAQLAAKKKLMLRQCKQDDTACVIKALGSIKIAGMKTRRTSARASLNESIESANASSRLPANVGTGIQSVMRGAEIYYNEIKLDQDGLILFEN